MIKTVRVYNSGEESGYRILVDRLWPRGVSKEDAKLDLCSPDPGPIFYHQAGNKLKDYNEKEDESQSSVNRSQYWHFVLQSLSRVRKVTFPG